MSLNRATRAAVDSSCLIVTPSDFARAATWASSSFAYRRSVVALVKAACRAATAAVSYNRFVWTSLMPSAFEVASRPAFSCSVNVPSDSASRMIRSKIWPTADSMALAASASVSSNAR